VGLPQGTHQTASRGKRRRKFPKKSGLVLSHNEAWRDRREVSGVKHEQGNLQKGPSRLREIEKERV